MNRQRLLWMPLVVCLFAFLLGVAPAAKADEIYSFTDGSVSWSFEVPSLIDTTTVITDFSTFAVTPGGNLGDPTDCSPSKAAPSARLGVFGGSFLIRTGVGKCTDSVGVLGGFPGEGTLSDGSFTLTVTPSNPSGVPEPSSALLLAVGIAGVVGWRRKKLA